MSSCSVFLKIYLLSTIWLAFQTLFLILWVSEVEDPRFGFLRSTIRGLGSVLCFLTRGWWGPVEDERYWSSAMACSAICFRETVSVLQSANCCYIPKICSSPNLKSSTGSFRNWVRSSSLAHLSRKFNHLLLVRFLFAEVLFDSVVHQPGIDVSDSWQIRFVLQ